MKLGQLAAALGCPLEGDANIDITGVGGIESAQPGEITYCAHPRYQNFLASSRASAVILKPGESAAASIAVLRSDEPSVHFARAIQILNPPSEFATGIHPTAVVAKSATIHATAHIGPHCFIGENVRIGPRAVLHSSVTIYDNSQIGDDFLAHSHVSIRAGSRIGNRVILQNGVVIGSDGFAFARRADGAYEKIRPTGIVVIGDDVEFQANSSVDAPTAGETVVESGCKFDSFVHIGHSCHIGRNTLLCAQVGLAGSINVGSNCIFAGQVGIVDHVDIGDNVLITAQSGVPNDIAANSYMAGSPIVNMPQWRKNVAALNYLPDLLKTVRRLESEIAALRSTRET